MPHNADRILTTHVGSLVRPPKLIEFWRAIEDGKPYDAAAFETCLTASVADVVREQAEVGIDVASDGEFSKGANWAFYVHKRLSGIAVRPADARGSRMIQWLPWAAAPITRHFRNSTPNMTPHPVSANGWATGSSSMGRSNTPTNRSPATFEPQGRSRERPGTNTRHWQAFCRWSRRPVRCPAPRTNITRTRRAFLIALADALHQEYKAIADAGLYVQIDDAFFPYMHERMVPPMTNTQYRRWAQLRIDALNHALRGIPEERSRYHICWGSWNGPHAVRRAAQRHHRSRPAGARWPLLI